MKYYCQEFPFQFQTPWIYLDCKMAYSEMPDWRTLPDMGTAVHLMHILQNIIKPNCDAQTHISPTLRWLTSISSFPFLLYPHRNFSPELTYSDLKLSSPAFYKLTLHTLIYLSYFQTELTYFHFKLSSSSFYKLTSHTPIWNWAHHPITNWSQGHDSLPR